MVCWWGEKGVYIWFPTVTSFGNIHCGMISYPKEVINGWDHLMHAIKLGSEVAQSLLVSHLEVEVYSKNKQNEILS